MVGLVEGAEGVIAVGHPLGLLHGVIGLVVIELVVVGQPLGLVHGVVVADAHPLGLVHDDVVVVGDAHPLGFVHDDVVVGVIQPLGFVHVSVPGVFDDLIEAVVPVSDFTLSDGVISVDLTGA